ncbi:hyaluronidase-1-like [Latimeria chalumnae]|uniref:hyaluronidase-1-like n=1 Tax=Latimeria chalumnae TaxID=7897 RepID=UPI0006D932D6|nr:PREDICTED: hyaluronidase-1-like [Latimeria chalumnae]|eukprot:XP_014343902.1 PREDICTED: hyaluronidase-1-like [Latimeria chalumnae]
MCAEKATVLLFFSEFLLWVNTLKPSMEPVLANKPFVAVWNAPTQKCKAKYNVELDLSTFDIVTNQNETFVGQNMTIFYANMLGHYPYYTEWGITVNGGVPQNTSLRDHLMKSKEDIKGYIPEAGFEGLAVLDWEKWKPLWKRNWDSKEIYREKSEELIREQHPNWTESRVRIQAQLDFQRAGRDFIVQTLMLGRSLRPKGLWGLYSFPCCYNNYKNSSHVYTGECPAEETSRNDQLRWLWEASTALYPSIYLPSKLKSSAKALKYVHYRVQEGLRTAGLASEYTLPVLPYARIVYIFSMDFLTQEDLIHTIGESAALGAAGIVLWGDADYARTKRSCETVKRYIDETLGRYIVNVTSTAALCSRNLCSQHGRCVRINSSSRVYLHLNPKTFMVVPNGDPRGPQFMTVGYLSKEDAINMGKEFRCNCYRGWKGTHCENKA